MKTNTAIPVTIITGFLGAGKTTLMNQILRQNPDKKFLIIENEAGELGIDGELLDTSNKNTLYELSDGCICCSLHAELGTLLNSIILSNVTYDYMLIEATGIADPGQVINMFSGVRVQRYFKLDGVVCLVDSGNFLNRLNHVGEIRKQLTQSDIILLNKTDLVSPEAVLKMEEQLKQINPLARLEKTENARIEADRILNCGLFQADTLEKSMFDFSSLSLDLGSGEHAHNIQALSFRIPGSFDMKKLSWWLENFLYVNSKNILRIKGILSIGDMKHKIALQSVGENFQISEGSEWGKTEIRESRMVFIGSFLDKKELQKNLYSLRTKTDTIQI